LAARDGGEPERLFLTCRAALRVMAAEGRGKVIAVASMWGLAAPAGAAVFLASLAIS
jgi:short-subunit dehydrogenase